MNGITQGSGRREEIVTLGGGCFWCTEAVFVRLKGVISSIPGYSGGHLPNPNYEQVSSGKTGHTEVIQVTYDPDVLTFKQILEIFFTTHDPTTINRQGADVGPQYRSVIFYHTDDQRKQAEDYIRELTEKMTYISKIVTKVEPFKAFYPAEEYHLEYYKRNPDKPYSKYVIEPKIEKLEKKFGDRLKDR